MTLFRRYERIPGHPVFERVADAGNEEQALRLARGNGTGGYVLTSEHETPRSDHDPYIVARISVQPDGRVRVTERRP
jgi:hypothetical protein